MGEPHGHDLPTTTPAGAPCAPHIRAPHSALDWAHARGLLREYAAAPELAACVDEIHSALDRLEADYSPPQGAFRLALLAEAPVGCFGLRALRGGDVELKRLYVRPAVRGRGVGEALLVAAIAMARAGGYDRLLLDTLPTLHAARALYLRYGFRIVPPYLDEPTPDAICYALPLQAS